MLRQSRILSLRRLRIASCDGRGSVKIGPTYETKLKLDKVKVDYRHNFLKLFPDPEIIFTCEFDSQVDNVSATHSVDDGTVVSEGTSSAGTFEFTLEMVVPADDGSGTFVAAPETDVVTVGERVHFQISNDNPLEGVHFFINECTVSDGVSSHSVIANNCGGNGVDAMIEGRVTNPLVAGHSIELLGKNGH